MIERRLAALPDKTKDGKDTKDGLYSIGINDNGDCEWRVAGSYLLGIDVLSIPIERQTNFVTKRLAEVMRTLGWSLALDR